MRDAGAACKAFAVGCFRVGWVVGGEGRAYKGGEDGSVGCICVCIYGQCMMRLLWADEMLQHTAEGGEGPVCLSTHKRRRNHVYHGQRRSTRHLTAAFTAIITLGASKAARGIG